MKRLIYTAIISAIICLSSPYARADLVDLTTAGSSGTAGGALFDWTDFQTTGTGVIDPFVRIQQNGIESGYNTDGTLEFDTKSGSFTHSITIGEIPIVKIGGTDYREFLLDINDNTGGDNELLSLDQVEIYLAGTKDLTGYPNLGTKIWSLNTITPTTKDISGTSYNYIKMDYSLNAGSGKGDVFMYIPDSLFAGHSSSTYLYLYSMFGLNYSSNAGFEEWSVRLSYSAPPPPPAAPVPGAVLLGLLGLSIAGLKLRRYA